MLQKQNIVVFDFDGTLSAGDSNMEFGKYCFRHSLRPWLFLPAVGVVALVRLFNPRGMWWRENIRLFVNKKLVEKHADNFIKQHRQNRFGWAKEQVAAERAAGNKVILVSASPNYLIPKLVRDMKFDAVICSQVDASTPRKFHFFCWGASKVVALDDWAAKNKIIPVVVRSYSDSLTDMPMMEIAHERVWVDRKTGGRIANGK